MPAADPGRCPTCGAARPADAPDGLCPRCVLGNAMESASEADDSRGGIFGSARMGRVLQTVTAAIGSSPQVLLPESDATVGGDDDAGVDGLVPCPRRLATPCISSSSARSPAGGMGAVLRGRDPDLGRDLAVKVLLEAHADKPDLVRRFIEEAQITGQLQHPGVVPVYELGDLRRPPAVLRHEAGEGPDAGRPAGRADGPAGRPAAVRRRSSSRSARRWPTPTPAG